MPKRRKTTREKLADLLRAEGFVVDASSLKDARGYWRTDVRADVYRWECYEATRPQDNPNTPGIGVTACSWNTMTDCVRHGIVVEREKSPCFYLIHSREPNVGTAPV